MTAMAASRNGAAGEAFAAPQSPAAAIPGELAHDGSRVGPQISMETFEGQIGTLMQATIGWCAIPAYGTPHLRKALTPCSEAPWSLVSKA